MNRLSCGRPSEGSGTSIGYNDNSSVSETSGSDSEAPSYGVIERRLRKAVKANTKWRLKYEIETWASPTCVILLALLELFVVKTIRFLESTGALESKRGVGTLMLFVPTARFILRVHSLVRNSPCPLLSPTVGCKAE